MDNQLLLSICIPTNGIVEWVVPVVESIYAQDIDHCLFEVVITDNGGKNELCETLKKYQYSNLHYYKTNAQGFTNQIDAFEKCSGLFCKMLNHRSMMLPGSIKRLIDLVEKNKDEKPIIYCAEGHAKGDEIIECKNVDEFVRSLSYWVSWSAGTGAWKSDLVEIRNKQINSMFPHAVYLFGLRDKAKYVIWNGKYEQMASDNGKGGYDLFHTFGVVFLDLLSVLRIQGRVSDNTFVFVKQDLLKFLTEQYISEVLHPTHHTFILENIPESLDVYYGRYYYWKMRVISRFKIIKRFLKRW